MKPIQSPAKLAVPPIGLGLRSPHLDEVSRTRPAVAFFEVHPENYILDKGGLTKLSRIRTDYPLSLHAVGLSLGSKDGVDEMHLSRLRDLADRLEPHLVSDHLSWSTADGVYLNDLLPLPYTKEACDVVARNVERVQSMLKRQILIENPSAYLRFNGDVFEEPEFLRMLVTRTGCGLLLDVNNVYVSAANLGFDTKKYLSGFPFEAVKEIHLAGHTRKEANGETILIDDHGSRASASVLSLYAEALSQARDAATLVEWDSNLPEFGTLLEERDRAAQAARTVLIPNPAPDLRTLQTEFAHLLLGGAENPGFGYTGHFSVHRNNVRESLAAALRAVYAGVEQLVGDAFFRQCAREFITAHPPRMPSLAAFGEEFPEFLGGLSSCAGLPYLADVARLEWLASRASLEKALPALSLDDLRPLLASHPERACFTVQPGLSYLSSGYPIDAIWGFAHAGGVGTPPRIDDDPVFLEIASGEDGVVFRRLEEADFAFRQALATGADIGTAAERALRADPLFVLFAALRSLIASGIFTDCHTAQSQSLTLEMRPCPC